MKKNKGSVIFCCQVYYPDEQSTSQLFTGIMESLALRGYEVKVLCGYPSNHGNIKISPREIHNGVLIERIGFQLSTKKNLFIRAVAYSSFLLGVVPRLIFSHKDSQVFAVTNPPFLAWICAFASIFRYRPYIFMFLDVHPEGLIALGKLSTSAWYVRLWKFINKVSYAKARKLLVLGRDMVPLLSKQYNLPESRFRYIPHWSATEVKEPISFGSSKFPSIWGLSDSFVVQYSGNMGLWHDIDTFVRAAKLLQRYTNIQFVFVGGGIRRNKARQLAGDLGVDNIRWEDFVPLSELSENLAGCHLALISLNKNLEGVAVPCKLYGILASGRPTIAQVPLQSEVAMCVLENNCGVVVPPGDADALAEVIYRLSMDKSSVEAMSSAAFNAYTSRYQIEDAVNVFEEELFN